MITPLSGSEGWNSVLVQVMRAIVTTQELSVAAHEALVIRSGNGAMVSFNGTVRDRDHGREVLSLEYVAHPDAQRVLKDIADEVVSNFPSCVIAVAHRTGRMAIGDTAFAVTVGSAHRSEAFAACGVVVEAVKAALPVWKKQEFGDGSFEWVNCA